VYIDSDKEMLVGNQNVESRFTRVVSPTQQRWWHAARSASCDEM